MKQKHVCYLFHKLSAHITIALCENNNGERNQFSHCQSLNLSINSYTILFQFKGMESVQSVPTIWTKLVDGNSA